MQLGQKDSFYQEETGAGKSSMLNYLFGTTFEAGAGKPVTGRGIYPFDAEVNGQKIRVFDSWGIEADKVKEWKELLDQTAEEHGAKEDPEKWFHAVVYCIQAGGGRVENIDAEIISRFVKSGYTVIAALTKIDQISEEDEAVLKKTIQDEVTAKTGIPESLKVISVCSEKKKTRMGETIPQGRDEMIEAILSCWISALKNRLPSAITERLIKILDDYDGELQEYISTQDVDGRPEANDALVHECMEKIDARTEELLNKDMENVTLKLMESCKQIGCNLVKAFDYEPDSQPAEHYSFANFFKENAEGMPGRVAGYICTLGIAALVRSLSDKQKAIETGRIQQTVSNDIAEKKEWMRANLPEKLKAKMDLMLESKDA